MADQFTSVRWDKDETTGEPDVPVVVGNPLEAPETPQLDSSAPNVPDPLSASQASHASKGSQDTVEDQDESGSGLITTQMIQEAHEQSPAKKEPSSGILGGASAEFGNSETPAAVTVISKAESPKAAVPGTTAPDAAQVKPQKPSYHIDTVVSDPVSEKEGQSTYISYKVHVKTDDPKLKEKEYDIRRRYSDFYFLYECLMNDFPTLLIPPLPNKQRLEYIKGGRFSDEFTAKRAVSLSTFLRRVTSHETLKRSQVVHIFLESSDYWNTYKQNLKVPAVGSLEATNTASQNLETVTEFIMNSFKKPALDTVNGKEYQEIQNRTAKLHDNLSKIDHIYGRVLHKQQSIADDISKFKDEFDQLTLLLSNDIDGKHQEADEMDEGTLHMVKQFRNFSSNLEQTSQDIYKLDHEVEYDYLTSLKDLEHYIMQLKNLIKLKDAKALDYEMLTNYLQKAKDEKTHLMNGGSITSSAEGTISFLTKKFESITGLGNGGSRGGLAAGGNITNERIAKLDARIQMLEKEKALAKKVFDQYEKDIVTEFEFFNKMKNDEIARSLNLLCGYYSDFYKNLSEGMKPVDLSTDGPLGFSDRLSKDGKLFADNQVQKNAEDIAKNIESLRE